MKKRYLFPFLMMAFLAIGFVPAHAEASAVEYVGFSVTEEERYNEDYYGEPELRFPVGKARTYSRAAEVSFEEYVVAALEDLESEVDISAYGFPATDVGLNEAAAEFLKVVNNNPQLFYVASACEVRASGTVNAPRIVCKPTYICTSDEVAVMRPKFESAANLAAAQVDKSLDEYQQALLVHDYLALNCEYDYDNYKNNKVPEISHTAYGSLVNQVAVCDGYADAFAYIMEDKLGISCEVISSDAMHHAWNMIGIGQEWYHVDVTWDDPAYDRIGRVLHENFLCSDSKISKDSPDAYYRNNHYSWSSAHKAESTVYDNEFWERVCSAICYQNGAWYYAKYYFDDFTPHVMKFEKRTEDAFLADEADVLYEFEPWKDGNSIWGGFMYLAQSDGKLYFNSQGTIYRLNNDDTKTEIYSPPDFGSKMIVGLAVRGNELWYVPQPDPRDDKKQSIQKYMLAQVEGISAEDVTGTYNGNPFTITVEGALDTDTIEYLDEDGNYQSAQPVMVDAGIYEVSYRVSRENYVSYRGTATVTIEQATPQYNVPTGLGGYVGDTLSTVTLPAGFTWQTEEDTRLDAAGTKTFLVKYTPQDTKNYKTVRDIEVEVQVTENTLLPIEGISAEDITVTYSGKAVTFEIQGLQPADVVTYALNGGAYAPQIPELKNVGTYEVSYKVERKGYRPYTGRVNVEIAKAVPDEDSYTVPTGCAGNSGDALQAVTLPDGFAWKDKDTLLREEGSHNYTAVYTPEDTENYQAVEVEVAVEVTCPGHQYESEITKEPTDTEDGEETYTCTLCGDSYTESIDSLLPAIKGISASDVSGIYNGRPYRIQVMGTKAGDVVTYALKQVSADDVGYSQEQPMMQRAGTYTVLYQVERTGYRPYRGSVTVEIARAIPDYTRPSGLSGVSGEPLSSVELPDGFLWQLDPDTKLSKEGYQKFQVCFRPQDQVNYEVVTNIEISIYVECPGHQYETVVTKEATETQKGIRTYTCKLCTRIYTEEIAMLAPARPGNLTGLSVSNVTTNAMSFSWKAETGVSYRLMFYEGNTLLSTGYVTGNTCTYQNLKSAAVYTLKVTPYRVVNGKNVYARTTERVKAATNPLKAKLSSAKRKGKSKVKLGWKKVDGASGYEIFMKTGNGKYKKIKTVGKSKTVSFTKARLSSKKSYSFKIRAYTKVDGVKVYGAFSNIKKVKKS